MIEKLRDTEDIIRVSNTHLLGILEDGNTEKGAILKEIMFLNFLV